MCVRTFGREHRGLRLRAGGTGRRAAEGGRAGTAEAPYALPRSARHVALERRRAPEPNPSKDLRGVAGELVSRVAVF